MQKWNLEKESIPDPRQDSVKPILEDSEQARAQKKDFGDALDGLHDDGGLHDHDDGLRGH
jgi:hypothetical protein